MYRRGTRDQWVAVADLGWRDGKRDRREFTSQDLDTALRKRAEFLALRHGGFTLPKGRKPYVSEWVLHWLENVARPDIDPNTYYRSYRQKVEDYIVPFFAKIKLAELAEDDIKGWHRWLAARPSRRGGTLSAATIVTAHRILSSSLNVAVAWRKLPHNPCTLAHPPKIRPVAMELPSRDEVLAVLEACEGREYGARWVLAICTGLRQGEALGLHWRDVKLTAPASVTVRQSLARVDKRDVLKGPKSAKSRRTVPLPARAVRALKEHRDEVVTDIGGAVFARPSRDDWQDWAGLLASLGLPHYRVHDLRHAYATMLLEEGADPRLVQDLMGWSSAKMSEVYQHVRPVMHEHARRLLDGALGG